MFAVLGLEDVDEVGGTGIERFTFVDQSTEGLDFFDPRAEFPWNSDNPNDLSGDQFCVQ